MTTDVRVVLADDHGIVRDGMRALLSTVAGMKVVGEAADADGLLDVAVAQSPDVAVVDLEMPGGGIAATRELARRCPHVRVLVLTMHADGQALVGALRAGAKGYLVKGAGRDEVIDAIRAVARGEAVLGTGVAEAGLRLVAEGRTSSPAFPQLSAREHEVLELIAAGLGNEEICLRFGLTLKTVRNNVASILTKLQVPDRATAVAKARDAGVGGPSRGR